MGSKGYMYIWDGGKLVSQYSATSRNISGNNLLDNLLNGVFGSIFGASETLEFLYDESGAPYGFIQGKKSFLTTTYTTYYYVTNLQGDIIAIVDGNGTRVASYTYNAWGEIIASTDDTGTGIVDTNPLRYRGYYYDAETGLYYLQSRYYDAGTGRFISADAFASTGQGFIGTNMFAYCHNNPVNFVDDGGRIPAILPAIFAVLAVIKEFFIWVTAAIGAIVIGTAFGKTLNCFIQEQVAVIDTSSISYQAKHRPPSLPTPKSVKINMEHIMSGHGSGGNRGGPRKDRFPASMTAAMIERLIREAYKVAEKMGPIQYSWSNGIEMVKQKFFGNYNGFRIEFWYNYTLQEIETAWPK